MIIPSKRRSSAQRNAEIAGEGTENLWVVQKRDNVGHSLDLMLHDDVIMGEF
jgi:hypothetical protein